jgi:hypothetical protein
MPRTILRSVAASLLIILVCGPVSTARQNIADKLSNIDRAVVFAVSIEARASRLENRGDVCVGFGDGPALDEVGILSELRRRGLEFHPNSWCNGGPRGLVISVTTPASQPTPNTYDLIIEVGDLRPIQGRSEHFGRLLRRGTYRIRCEESSKPELVYYQQDPQQEFKVVKMGELMDEGVHFGITTYVGQSGLALNVIHADLGSPAAANKWIERKISEAQKLIDQAPEENGNGILVGTRAEISFETGDDRPAVAVLWTNRQAFYEITSLSLKDARELEKLCKARPAR